MLVKVSLNDSQVPTGKGQAVAKLRDDEDGRNPLLLKANWARSWRRSGRYDALHDTAFNCAFILWQMGIAP